MNIRVTVVVAALLFSSALCAQQRPPVKTADQRALDAAVMAAIARNDLAHARALAVTAEHWGWINGTQQKPQGQRSRAEVRQEMANSQECKDAQRSYQLESNSTKKNWAAIQAKEHAARSACGGVLY